MSIAKLPAMPNGSYPRSVPHSMNRRMYLQDTDIRFPYLSNT